MFYIDRGIGIKSWCPEIETSAMVQAYSLANLPFAFKHIAIMPDCHAGKGMPIGGVLAIKKVIIPNAVGVDIGCGMCAIRTNIKVEEITQEDLKKILGGSKEYKGGIRSNIPVGFSHNSKKQEWEGYNEAPNINIINEELEASKKQLGTLGGGNHFIEIQKGSDGFIWVMLHSGSRNFGYKIANHYSKIAQELNTKWFSNIPKDLAFLPLDTNEGQEYKLAMEFALEFALQNRLIMIERCKEAIQNVFNNVEFDNFINIHHNYASIENHFNENVIVHRKGATRAYKDELGIIPGSQGTCSYIVKGLGNPESFKSCSHGAGRKLSRTKAISELDFDTEVALLDNQNILHGIRHKKNLDEAPSAYKDIDEVMENQKDLVEIVTKLKPLAVIKG